MKIMLKSRIKKIKIKNTTYNDRVKKDNVKK